jgi:hypothetical protein
MRYAQYRDLVAPVHHKKCIVQIVIITYPVPVPFRPPLVLAVAGGGRRKGAIGDAATWYAEYSDGLFLQLDLLGWLGGMGCVHGWFLLLC